MRKQTSTGLRVLFAFLVLSVGPLAFVTATPTQDVSHQHAQTQNNVTTDKIGTFTPSPATHENPFTRVAHIIEESGYSDVSLASVGTSSVQSYSRYDDSDPLKNQVRMKIHEAIKQSPGASISEISEQTGIHRSTVRYHVRILGEEQLTTSKSHRGKHRLYPVDESKHRLYAALNEDTPATILKTIVQQGSLTVTDLSTAVDRSPGTVSYHLDRLADDDLIQKNQNGNTVAISATDEVRAVFTEHPSMIVDSEASAVASSASLD